MTARSDEIAAYIESIRDRLEQIGGVVHGMSADELNYRPPAQGANSAWVLAVHAVGNARAWALGIACGRPVRRDRPAEFASSGADAAALLDDIDRSSQEIRAALASLDPARLGVRLVPPKELWGEGEPHEISVRDAILQVVEHASMHLGHLQLTRDLARAGTAARGG
jgi:hypothetical protein